MMDEQTAESIWAQCAPLITDAIKADEWHHLSREAIPNYLCQLIQRVIKQHRLSIQPDIFDALLQIAVDELHGFGPVERLIRDETITDILINGPYEIYVERDGFLEKT